MSMSLGLPACMFSGLQLRLLQKMHSTMYFLYRLSGCNDKITSHAVASRHGSTARQEADMYARWDQLNRQYS